MTQEIFRLFKFVHNCQVRVSIKGVRNQGRLSSADKGRRFFMGGPLALRLFQNDYITSFKFKKLNSFCFNFEYYFEWLAPKAAGHESGGVKVTARKSSVPPGPGGSEVTFLVFESSCHLLLPV